MTRQIKAEWLKEKRTANYKLLLIAPLLFVLLSFLLVLLMGTSPDGEHSYIVAATFNWYSLLILPVIITLMVTNNLKKEKEVNQVFYYTTGASLKKQMIAKNLVVIMELLIILLLSTFLVFLLGSILLDEELSILTLMSAVFYLLIGSLPIIAISFILYRFFNRTLTLLVNFILGNIAAVIAVETWWWLFPWSYNLRMMAPALGVHPNGTFLSSGDPLLNRNALIIGVIMGLLSYFILLVLQILLTWRQKGNA